jgi:hypothetical protein
MGLIINEEIVRYREMSRTPAKDISKIITDYFKCKEVDSFTYFESLLDNGNKMWIFIIKL